MKLGKIQKEWVKSLKAHPKRQIEGILGKRYENKPGYKACCLGELLMCEARIRHKKLPFVNLREDALKRAVYNTEAEIKDGTSISYLSESYKRLGLRSHDGNVANSYIDRITDFVNKNHTKAVNIPSCFSLASMNDNKIPWPLIAEVIEKYPEAFFTKSV